MFLLDFRRSHQIARHGRPISFKLQARELTDRIQQNILRARQFFHQLLHLAGPNSPGGDYQS
jgi:hypothetical protein